MRPKKGAGKKWGTAVRERDLFCRLEWYSVKAQAWIECGHAGAEAAHIYRRWKCGPAKYDLAVGIFACVKHHRVLDANEGWVRVPLARQRAALRAINAVCKVKEFA